MENRSERRKAIARLLGSGGAVLALMALPATSQASAYGIQYWSPHSVNIKGQSVPIPSGQLAHMIEGHGDHVDWDGANFVSAANLCDSSMRFTYGNGSQHFDGGLHSGCSHVGQWKYNMNREVPRGSACAELWAHNWRILVARQCHYVHP